MGDGAVKEAEERSRGKRFRLSPGGTVLLVLVAAGSAAAILLTIPRAIPPTEMPALRFDLDDADEVVEQDRERAGRLDESPELAALEAGLLALGRLEIGEAVEEPDARAQTAAIERAFAGFLEADGEDAGARLVARWVQRADDLDDPDREAVRGGFPDTLRRYGLPVGGGDATVTFVRRTLFKARVNAALQRTLTADFAPVELQAYWGWLAYGADGIEPVRRLAALAAFEDAGGTVDHEARGMLRYLAGDTLGAAEAYRDAYEATGSLRLRNHALAVASGGETP